MSIDSCTDIKNLSLRASSRSSNVTRSTGNTSMAISSKQHNKLLCYFVNIHESTCTTPGTEDTRQKTSSVAMKRWPPNDIINVGPKLYCLRSALRHTTVRAVIVTRHELPPDVRKIELELALRKIELESSILRKASYRTCQCLLA